MQVNVNDFSRGAVPNERMDNEIHVLRNKSLKRYSTHLVSNVPIGDFERWVFKVIRYDLNMSRRIAI